jgi:hypothetical protein
MTREFPDELLSALLDDELSPSERAKVERHLAASEADRQLLAELKSLRADVATLPKTTVTPGFADRVVRAAVTEAERLNGHRGLVSKAPPGVKHFSKRRMVGAAAASAAALAASFLLLVAQPWRPAANPNSAQPLVVIPVPGVNHAVALKDQLLQALRVATPAEGEAVVLRLRVGKDVPLADALESALGKAGIAARLSADPAATAALVAAYGRALEAKYGPGAAKSDNPTLADAAAAVFISAPLERLEAAFNELASGLKQPLELEAATKLALARARPEDGPEGEFGSANKVDKAAAGQSFAQRLDAGLFRVEKKLTDATAAAVNLHANSSPLQPQDLVRVLILIEAE